MRNGHRAVLGFQHIPTFRPLKRVSCLTKGPIALCWTNCALEPNFARSGPLPQTALPCTVSHATPSFFFFFAFLSRPQFIFFVLLLRVFSLNRGGVSRPWHFVCCVYHAIPKSRFVMHETEWSCSQDNRQVTSGPIGDFQQMSRLRISDFELRSSTLEA